MFKHKFEYREGQWFAPPIDPADKIDFELDFIEFLAARREDDGEYILNDDGEIELADEINEVEWTVSPATITIIDARLTHTDRTATIWVEAATQGFVYTITANVTTTGGREFSRSFQTVCRKS